MDQVLGVNYWLPEAQLRPGLPPLRIEAAGGAEPPTPDRSADDAPHVDHSPARHRPGAGEARVADPRRPGGKQHRLKLGRRSAGRDDAAVLRAIQAALADDV
jgi:hypothetical protein